MTTTLCCDDCGKAFTQPSRQHAECALRMHRWRVHSKTKRTTRKVELPVPALREAPVEVQPDSANDSPDLAVGESLRFCPCCGVNLGAIAMALRIASKIG